MTSPYDQQWEDTRIYGYNLSDSAQSFHPLAPDLDWSASAEFEGFMPNDVVPISSFLSLRTQPNSLAVQGGSTRAMSTSVPHQQIASNPGIAAYPNLSQEPAVISQGRNSTRSHARRNQISGSASHSPDDPEFRCKWEDCSYMGTFKRESSLIRHIRKIHVSPLAHLCPVQGCEKAFNRADNLAQHTRNNHYIY
ncbi:uncharacterized protein N7479_003605 [Penicillium vulpinum]|uniref:C2H2-type domain-containing protein n=1 Tax=Penicillium vulpinum TaxID=29845 RepID=A0A1V6RX47_9EURO|nr:uncharacterized protein N7479_003605 [Penicillium vulpinum]KAJ5963729.1 hypothetical protein N7479_003605 [Penicillium vulpinum]OQE05983.1 hypothetical protein PENVUL_c020G06989 [Penicillium vulpinum]